MSPEQEEALVKRIVDAVKESVGGPCLCRLEPEDRKDMGHLLNMSRDVGIEEMRDNHQFVSELRKGVGHAKITALTVAVGSILTAIGAGLVLLFKAKVG